MRKLKDSKSPKLSKKEGLALQDFKNRLIERLGDNFLFIKLYGSRARGDSHKHSDIDIVVVLKKLDNEIDDIVIDTSTEILYEYDVDLKFLTFSQERYERCKREQWPFFINVEQDGILI